MRNVKSVVLSPWWKFNRTWRRIAVVTQILLSLGIISYSEWYISTSSSKSSFATQDWYYLLWLSLLTIALLATIFLIRFSVSPFVGYQIGFLFFSRKVKLDERQQIVRDRAFRIAHRITLFLLLGAVVMFPLLFGTKLVLPPRGVLFWFWPFWCIAMLIINSPMLVVAWTEPDVEKDEAIFVTAHPKSASGKVLRFRERKE